MPSIRAVPKLLFTTASVIVSADDCPGSLDASSASAPTPASAPMSRTSTSTDTPMGIIMTAVAVLDTHIDRNPVAIMKPATTIVGLVPMARTVRNAMRRWRFQRCIASATRKPPMKRKMMLLP